MTSVKTVKWNGGMYYAIFATITSFLGVVLVLVVQLENPEFCFKFLECYAYLGFDSVQNKDDGDIALNNKTEDERVKPLKLPSLKIVSAFPPLQFSPPWQPGLF